jgi:hypothetical protein
MSGGKDFNPYEAKTKLLELNASCNRPRKSKIDLSPPIKISAGGKIIESGLNSNLDMDLQPPS